MHFMVTQGLRDRKTLRVNYPLAGKKLPGGETNPATQQIDFYIRSPQQNPKNRRSPGVHAFFRDGDYLEVAGLRTRAEHARAGAPWIRTRCRAGAHPN